MNKIRDLIVILIGYCICFYLMMMSWNLMFEINIWLQFLYIDVAFYFVIQVGMTHIGQLFRHFF